MKLYRISCPGCGWKSPLMVAESVANQFKGLDCVHCKHYHPNEKRHPQYIVNEVIVTRPMKYFPGKE
jgi:hypothetical protein